MSTTGDPAAKDGQDPTDAPGAKPDPNDSGQVPQTFSREYVEELRREAADRRKAAQDAATERDALKARLDEHAAAQLTEQQRAEKERDEAKAAATAAAERAQRTLLKADVKIAAAKLGFADADDALALLPPDAIKFNDDGEPVGVEKALEALAAKKPHLLAAGSGNPATPGRPAGGSNRAFTAEEIGRMSPAEYRKNRDAIFGAHRAGRVTT